MTRQCFLAHEGDAPIISVTISPELSARFRWLAEVSRAYAQTVQQTVIAADEFNALMRVMAARRSHAFIHRALARGAAHKRKTAL